MKRGVIVGIVGRLLEPGEDLWSFVTRLRQDGEKEVGVDTGNLAK